MSKKTAVFGLGKIGASIAMAIKAYGKDCRVIGADPERAVEEDAVKKGRVDEAVLNIHDAAEAADLIILALPVNRTRETLESLGRDLKEETVVLDCCPDKRAAADWARHSLAHPENYLGICPGLNPNFLFETSVKAQSVSADLFRGAVLQIASDAETSERAINAALELAAALGMEPSFIDPAELDGMLAGTRQLPFLLGCGLFHTCANRPGWTDARQMAGRHFAAVASVLEEADAEDCAAVLLNNRENEVRLLDELMETLKRYRDALENNDETELQQLLEKDPEAYMLWKKGCCKSGRAESNPSDTPRVRAADVFSQTFFGGLLRKKN